MKLEDLIAALAEEITSVIPQLNEYLNQLAVLPPEDNEFIDTLDLYSGQIQRMGEAADMVGFSGLLVIAEHLQENTLILATLPPNERGELVDFLRKWPELMVHYLENLDDASVASGLIDALRDAPHPMEEDACLHVMYKLGSMPIQMDLGEAEAASSRPVLASSKDISLDIPEDVEQRLMESFLQEAPEQTANLVTLMGNITTQSPADMGDLAAAKRAVHTLKGTSAIIGIKGLANLGHHFEDVLEFFEKNEGDIPNAVHGILIDTAYCFEQIVAFIGGQDEYPSQMQAILQDVLDLANRMDKGEDLTELAKRGENTTAPQTPNVVPQQATPKRSTTSALRIDLDKIDELFRVSAEVSVHTAAMEAQIKQLNDGAKELLNQHLKVKKRLYELETVVDVRTISMMRSMSKGNQSASFDPLEMEQYNELHSTAHAMVEDASDAIELGLRFEEKIAQLATLQTKQQNLSRDLQHLVIGTRMAEVGTLEPRLQRNIRTTCQATGKQAILTLKGGSTLIDSDVLSHLSEPLLHLLRNAIDHGLETPAERMDSGKEATGHILLDFSKQGQQVVLRCQDDGKGLDYEQIRQRGVEKGLITAEQNLSENELARLILLPGFSTRDSVSQVSGRGVGLDVVNEWASRMNGEINVFSTLGQGMTIELRFAASLSTAQALIVETSEQAFALPSIQIEQALARGVGEFVIADEMLQFHHDERVLAGRFLADLVGLPREDKFALEDYNAVIVKIRGELYALAVEKLVDSRELLIRDPGLYTRHLPEIAGMSILGDGSVTAHLDLSQLISNKQVTRLRKSVGLTELPSRKSNKPKILIVDDSLSVRNVLQELIEDLGFLPKTALDGINAIEVMEDFQPDLILTDLEMPNMNGVELIAHIRGRQDIGKVPIIMITSRSQTKHKELADRAGADEYVTKPYNEATLIQLINQYIMT